VIQSEADIASLDFDKTGGLLPAIIQHADTGAVLMLGYMNPQALATTLARGRVVFWSRSKQRLWEKGETSGHTLDVVAIHEDCDQDSLLVLARPAGPVCHTGTATCFGDGPLTRAEALGFLGQLEQVIEQRISAGDATSYTARLFNEGTRRLAQKVGEEGVEVALAGVADDDTALVNESADLLFHLAVLLRGRGLSLENVAAELAARHRARS
jgi:phosphoribosyl-AMP cyclohydrolase / phosphoribosyl-ATP pyrophosphohydrolase